MCGQSAIMYAVVFEAGSPRITITARVKSIAVPKDFYKFGEPITRQPCMFALPFCLISATCALLFNDETCTEFLLDGLAITFATFIDR